MDNGRLQGALIIEEFNDFFNILYAIYFQVIYYGSFPGVLFGEYKSFEPLFAGTDGDGKGSFDGLKASVQAQLADDEIA